MKALCSAGDRDRRATAPRGTSISTGWVPWSASTSLGARLVVRALLGLTLGAACKPKQSPNPPDALPHKVTLVVRGNDDSNEGRPLHVVVRGVGRKTFVEDAYGAIASLVTEPDESVASRVVVFPGKVYVVDLEFPEVPEVIGVYGLFTRTRGESWKLAFEEVKEIDIEASSTGFVPRATSVPR